jgi:hypothetical protein
MANRSEGLITDSLIHLWNATSAPAAGTTCVANSGAVGTTKPIITHLGWSIRNATAASYTATLSVRDVSAAGTVLASWDVVCAANVGQLDNFGLNIIGSKSGALFVDFGTPAASVTQKVSIAGWRNQSDNS